MPRYVLSRETKQDLRNIARYTERKWGASQRRRYLKQLRERIKILAISPHIGRRCLELKNTPFKYHEGRHLIFYRPIDGGIEIVRVLHDAMDVPRHLP